MLRVCPGELYPAGDAELAEAREAFAEPAATIDQLRAETADLTAKLFEVPSDKQFGGLREVRRLRGHTQPIQAVAYSPDGLWMATGDKGGTVRIWEAGEKHEQRMLPPGQDPVVSPDGRRLAYQSCVNLTVCHVELLDLGAANLEAQ